MEMLGHLLVAGLVAGYLFGALCCIIGPITRFFADLFR